MATREFRAFEAVATDIIAALRDALGPDAAAQVQGMSLDAVRSAVPDCAAAQDALAEHGGRYARCMYNYIRARLGVTRVAHYQSGSGNNTNNFNTAEI